MNSRRSARQMGRLDSPMTPRYSTMKASEPSRFWMPPESRARLEYTPPAAGVRLVLNFQRSC